jgi:hypothetical protein
MAYSVSADGASSGGRVPDGSHGPVGLQDGLAPGAPRFRLWIASYSDWQPAAWNQVPPRATAVEPVDQALCTAEEAALFLQGFNSSMLAHHEPIWAVAVPITLCYEGDAVAGSPVRGHVFPLDEPTAPPDAPASPPDAPAFPLDESGSPLTSRG